MSFVELEILTRLYNWRLNLAQRTDQNLVKIISDQHIVQYAKANVSTMEDTTNFFLRFQNVSQIINKQLRMIHAYQVNDTVTITKKESGICHNCNMQGHLAVACAEMHNAQARAAFLNRPENNERKQRQQEQITSAILRW